MTHPDDIPVGGDDDEAGLDPSAVSAARRTDADEADLIEQATVIPVADDDDVDR
jgi:hypothetical protein